MKVLRSMLVALFAVIVLAGCQTKTETPAQTEGAAPQQEAVEQNPHTAAPEAVATEAAPSATETAPAVAGNVTSVADVFAKKADLDKKSVTISGKVVKISKGILGSNWLHIQDGTGAAGSNDLTVTTQAEPNVGDKVTATGIVALNKDFGAGYKYDIIIEKATVTKN